MNNLSNVYELATEYALSTNRSIFITGKAGTGKTTFLRKLKDITHKQMAIVAPTGVAAINAGGTTIHSFFQLPFSPFIPTAQGRRDLIEKIRMAGFRRKVLQELELLVIDEISMVRADVLDAIDTVLRSIRFRHNEAFGGVQVIFIGDMFQLSPVAVDDELRLLSSYYKSIYYFHSQVITQQTPLFIEFDTIFRQTNGAFINILNQVRNNSLTPRALDELHRCYKPGFLAPENETWITLTTHNYKAERINAVELNKLNSKSIVFSATVSGEFPDKSFPTEKELELKEGARVMFIKNDTETVRRFYNGKIGVVKRIEKDRILIDCPGDDEPIEITRMTWENMRYQTNETTRQIDEEVLGTFTQFPLRLAWAITIHKSQGLTFDKAIIDAGDAFAPGQVYVALSRCRSLDGLVLLSRINPGSITNQTEILEFDKSKTPLSELEFQLTDSRNLFRHYLLTQLFDFRTGIGHLSRLKRELQEKQSSFNPDTFTHTDFLMHELQEMQQVANKFQSQLNAIFATREINDGFLAERIAAAINYFNEKFEIVTETILQSPAVSDSRDNARNYTDQLKSIFAFIKLKTHIFEHLTFPFTAENYFECKNSFKLPLFDVNAYAAQKKQKQIQIKNAELFNELAAIRNRICEPLNLPLYMVAGTTSLAEMSEYLPENQSDLLLINGFGPSKTEKYGEEFLEAIRNYCSKHNLTTDIEKLKALRKPAKKNATNTEKKQKGDSQKLTFELYKVGKSIDEIAKERNLSTSTICTHLGRYIELGNIDIDRFITADKREMAINIVKTAASGEIYSSLVKILTSSEISLFLSWYRAASKHL